MRRYRPFLYILMFSAAASGCAEVRSPLASFRPPSGVVAKTSPGLSAYNLRRIGILPFQNESGAPAAGNKLADLFYEGLSNATRYEMEPPPLREGEDAQLEFRLRGGRAAGVRNIDEDTERLQKKIREFISTIGPYVSNLETLYPGEYFEGRVSEKKIREFKGTVARASPGEEDISPLDAVVTGVVTKYRDRSGQAYAGDKGAQVTYTAYLISTKDGKILWQAAFNEEQILLFENLLLFERYAQEGFSWQTNDTLARHGLKRVLATFPRLEELLDERTPGNNP